MLTALSDLLDWYPTTAPQTLAELLEHTPDQLKVALAGTPDDIRDKVYGLRTQGADLRQAADRPDPLSSPDAVLLALRHRRLQPVARRWMVYPLDERRRRVAAPHKAGGSRYVVNVYDRIPSAADLPPIPDGGAYLILYGGSPDVLERHEAIPEILARLQRTAPVVDVLFWHLPAGAKPCLYSLTAGIGAQDGTPVEFPNPTLAKEARHGK